MRKNRRHPLVVPLAVAPDMLRKSIAEIIGTFALVFCGTGAIVIDKLTGGGVSHVGVAITFGLIVMAMIYGLGEISGAHLNPAVTIGLWLQNVTGHADVVGYSVAQLVGGVRRCEDPQCR